MGEAAYGCPRDQNASPDPPLGSPAPPRDASQTASVAGGGATPLHPSHVGNQPRMRKENASKLYRASHTSRARLASAPPRAGFCIISRMLPVSSEMLATTRPNSFAS